MAGKYELVVVREVAIQARGRLVICENRCLCLLAFQVKDSNLMVGASSH